VNNIPSSFQSEPPERQPQTTSIWKKLLAPFVGILYLLSKFKLLLIPVLKFFPLILKTGGTMLISVGVYALIYGLPFAAGFVLLIFIHEYGHLYAAKKCNLKVGWPVFIPFMGASIALKEAPPSARIEAEVGIGGPIWGTMGAIGCLFLYQLLHYPLLLALSYTGFWLNLFNLIPIIPLDGGRIVAAISPWLWVVGLVLMIIVLFTMSFNIFILIIVGMSIPRVIAFFRNRNIQQSEYYDLTPRQRLGMGIQYFGLAGVLGFLMHMTHQQLQVLHSQ
jgi:Zn-dependent protease